VRKYDFACEEAWAVITHELSMLVLKCLYLEARMETTSFSKEVLLRSSSKEH
jgi:hypothetical protein